MLPPEVYARHDESPDDHFHSVPCKVVQIDERAVTALGRLYAEVLPAAGRLLDLMSSWRSHLPERLRSVTRAAVSENEEGFFARRATELETGSTRSRDA